MVENQSKLCMYCDAAEPDMVLSCDDRDENAVMVCTDCLELIFNQYFNVGGLDQECEMIH